MKRLVEEAYTIKKYSKEYEQQVLEQAYYQCIALLEEDLEHAFVILKEGEYQGFGYLHYEKDYAELNGPFYVKPPKDSVQIKILKSLLKGIRAHYLDLPIYFFTDYPESFEKFGCKVAFDAPSDILLKAAPG